MKKLVTGILTLALCMTTALPAFAADTIIDQDVTLPTDGKTTVSFHVDPTYTITIPATVTLEQTTAPDGTVTYESTETISADAGLRLEESGYIQVSLTACDYTLTAGDYTDYELPYTVKVGSTEITSDNNKVAAFTTENNSAIQTSTLSFAAENPTYAGEYSDTVTFTVAVAWIPS